MIPRNTMDVTNVESNFDGETINMSIDENSLSHIMSVLTDLYSDTMLASIREYSTNARDAHIEAGKADIPIEISVPTKMSPVFKVRDYGLGLSLEDIRNVYSKYGASTKRGSDKVNGMLGLGAKAALTYTSSFTVVATKNGVKNIVSVGRSEDGSGYMEIVDTLDTTDANGVEIQIPVSIHDTSLFQSKIDNFFTFWEPGTVKINGEVNKGFDYSDFSKIDDRTYLTSSYNSLPLGSTIVMGGVAYPVPFSTDFGGPWTKYLYFADMGDVVFSPSRESLQTNKQNRDLCDKIKDTIVENVVKACRDQVKTAGNTLEAVRLANKVISNSVTPVLGWRSSPTAYDMAFNGKTLSKFRDEVFETFKDDATATHLNIVNSGCKSNPVGMGKRAERECNILASADVIINGVDSEIPFNSGRRGVILRGMRELGYVDKSVILMDDSSDLERLIDGGITVVSMAEVRKASTEALKRTRTASAAKKKANAAAGLADVITSIDGTATLTTEVKSISGDGSDVVFLARGSVRTVTGPVDGYNSYERARQFRLVMSDSAGITFVAVPEKDEAKFLKVFPKARSFRTYLRDASGDSFVDEMIATASVKITRRDVFNWTMTRAESWSPFSMRVDDVIMGIYNKNTPSDGPIAEYANMVNKNDVIQAAFNAVKSSAGSVFNDTLHISYVRSMFDVNTAKTQAAVVSEINDKYPMLSQSGRMTAHQHIVDHAAAYVAAVDSGIIA